MAIPHTVFKQKAKERLRGKDGKEKIQEIKKLISELPGYYTGPYGEIRKWLREELVTARVKKAVKHRDWFAVKKEGDVQIALLGAPNVGKSSLLKALTDVQTKVASYAFTTLKPVPAICNINGADVQFVEVPGLIEGAHEGKGMGRKLLSVAKGANFVIVVHNLEDPAAELAKTIRELQAAGLKDIALIVGNKSDLPEAHRNLEETRRKFHQFVVIPVSAEKRLGLEQLRQAVWNLLRLIRVFPKDKNGKVAERPVLLPKGSTTKEFAVKIHKEIVEDFRYAKVWGASAKFPGQEVGFAHQLKDNDIIQLHV